MLTGQSGIGEQRRTTDPPDSATGQIGMVRTVAGPRQVDRYGAPVIAHRFDCDPLAP